MGEYLRMNQALNYMMQSRASVIPMGRFNRIYGENQVDDKHWGQVRWDLKTNRLVKLVMGHLETGVSYPGVTHWTVEDILSGEEYDLVKCNIGSQTFNAMEVIAWAAK